MPDNMDTQPAEARPVRETCSVYTEFAMPNDANVLGNLFGGKVMALVDLAGAAAAVRHARATVVTASVDELTFLHPIHIGEIITLHASVNRVFHTSMEVGVKVVAENPLTGVSRHTCSAYLTFVAISAQGTRLRLPQVRPESPVEIRRWEQAALRREHRLRMRSQRQARQ